MFKVKKTLSHGTKRKKRSKIWFEFSPWYFDYVHWLYKFKIRYYLSKDLVLAQEHSNDIYACKVL